MQYPLVPVRKVHVKKTRNRKCRQGCRKNELMYMGDGKGMQTNPAPVEKSVVVLQSIKNRPILSSSNSTPRYYLKNGKAVTSALLYSLQHYLKS